MKKKLIAVSSLLFATVLAFGACTSGNAGGSSSSSETKEGLQVELLDLGADFSKEYYPVTEKLTERQGKIDVSILFEDTVPGWEAVANEYMRLHREQVVINLDKTQSASDYGNALNYQLSGGTEWDIVQGNLAAAGYMQRYCYNMYPAVQQTNYYAGDFTWRDVLEEDAYQSDKSGASTQTYLMNSEGLQTAWFVNTVAMNEAIAKGYKTEEGTTGMPKTWDDLMFLCEKMQEAGYTNPLGISLASDSISASQFTWLLRVYGDYYYRNEYNSIMKKEGYDVKLNSPNPEAAKDYDVHYSSLFHIVLGEGLSGQYVGATSAKFLDFVSQLGKMRPYLLSDAAGKAFTDMRADFQTQVKKKASPQIMLDYVGAGLSFLNWESESFKMDFFDYPYMYNEHVSKDTLLRDVGGNGGYLSIVNHDNDQNELTLDFVKFFMSPYGQTVYYKGLSEGNAAPKGLTLVVNDAVVVPEAWKNFFATNKISFTGLSDSNPFIGYFIRGLDSRKNSSAALQSLWSTYLTTDKPDDEIDLESEFGVPFHESLMADWEDFCVSKQFAVDCYKDPSKYEN